MEIITDDHYASFGPLEHPGRSLLCPNPMYGDMFMIDERQNHQPTQVRKFTPKERQLLAKHDISFEVNSVLREARQPISVTKIDLRKFPHDLNASQDCAIAIGQQAENSAIQSSLFHGKIVVQSKLDAMEHALDEYGPRAQWEITKRHVFWVDGFTTRGSRCSTALVHKKNHKVNESPYNIKGFAIPSYMSEPGVGTLSILIAVEAAYEQVQNRIIAHGSTVAIYSSAEMPLRRIKEFTREREIRAWDDCADEDVSNLLHGYQAAVTLRIIRLARALQSMGVMINLHWVPSRKNIPGNALAEDVAKRAALLSPTTGTSELLLKMPPFLPFPFDLGFSDSPDTIFSFVTCPNPIEDHFDSTREAPVTPKPVFSLYDQVRRARRVERDARRFTKRLNHLTPSSIVAHEERRIGKKCRRKIETASRITACNERKLKNAKQTPIDPEISLEAIDIQDSDGEKGKYVPQISAQISDESLTCTGNEEFAGRIVIQDRLNAMGQALSEHDENGTFRTPPGRHSFYVDASVSNNATLTGLGVVYKTHRHDSDSPWTVKGYQIAQPLHPDDAEAWAISQALHLVLEKVYSDQVCMIPGDPCSIAVVYSDSQNALQELKRNDRRRPKVSEKVVSRIINQSMKLKGLSVDVHLHWVPGHSAVPGNELADMVAKKAREKLLPIFKRKKLDDKVLGPYSTVDQKGTAYQVNLPPTMKIYDVSHPPLLRKAANDPLRGQIIEPSAPVVVEGEEEYEAEEILDARLHYGRLQYRVKWKGYPARDMTWYNASDGEFDNARDIVDDFYHHHPDKPTKSTRSRTA